MVRKSGGVMNALISAVRAVTPSARGRVSLAVITDVTAMAEAARVLRDSEARYRSLVEDQSDLVFLATTEGEILYVNSACVSFFRRRAEELIGMNLLDFVPEKHRAGTVEHLRRVCATREKVESANQIVTPDGARRWFSWTNRALVDSDGEISAIHSVGRDIQTHIDAERRLQESEARYRFLAENSTDMILLVGHDGKRLYASPASRRLLGYEPDEAIALSLKESIHPDDAPRVLPILAAQPTDTLLTYRLRRKDGGYVWVETTGKTVDLANGERQRLIIVRDNEKRVAAEEALKASEARYRLLADNSSDVVMALDRNLVRTYVSPASLEMFGYPPEELVGSRTGEAAHPDDAGRFRENLQSLLDGRVDKHIGLSRRRHRDGRWIWTETCYRAVRDPTTGAVSGIVASVRDISARKAIEDQLAEANARLAILSAQDGLTGLANRRIFDEAFAREYRRAMRDQCCLALIMIDVDRFKAFNDLYGHPAGDECLRRVAEAIAGSIRRPGDVAARYGGEEFAIVLPDTDEAGALVIATRMRHAVLEMAIPHSGSESGVVTICGGVAAARPHQSEDAAGLLLREADRALYLAKNGGRNAVMIGSLSRAAAGRPPSTAA
jgi:diguanylate cyclase (GGDEF)-like protein/PAS domain S-box-containing protein